MPPPVPPRRPVDQLSRPLPRIVPLTAEQELRAALENWAAAYLRQAAKDKPKSR